MMLASSKSAAVNHGLHEVIDFLAIQASYYHMPLGLLRSYSTNTAFNATEEKAWPNEVFVRQQ